MPFTKENRPFIEEAASIDFHFTSSGAIAYRKHTKHELGLYFIKQAVEKHGHKYGYSKVVFTRGIDKVILRCRDHGDFEQTPHSHLRGRACPKCANLLKMSTTEDFIKRALDIHGNKYDYSETQYSGMRNKVTVICEKHGRYSIQANNHIHGHGCAQCAGTYSPNTEEFIEKAREVHGDKYGYSSVHYKGSQEKIEIFCPLPNHGTFMQTPANHLQGNGCPKCAKYDTQEDFILKAVEVHRGKYVYSSVDYLNSKTKVEIFCAVPGHGTFFQTPANHLRGEGCPKCVGQNHNILYLLKCLDTGWYKIGITTGNVQKRITSIGGNIEEVYHVKLADPRKHETILHKRYENAREYNLCVKNGNTEFFSLTKAQVKEVCQYIKEVSDG